MRSLWADIRFGLRMMAKAPGFTAIVVLCLALGIGANTATFSIIYEALLRPLPHYRDADRLVSIRGIRQAFPDSDGGVSLPDLADLRQRSTCFAQLTSCYRMFFTLSDESSHDIWGLIVSEGFLETLGVRPVLGRTFSPEEYRTGGELVVTISGELWTRRFGAAPGIIGQTLILNRKTATIVGVMPHGFIPQVHSTKRIDIYTPSVGLGYYRVNRMDRKERLHRVIARLNPNVTIAQAQAEVDGICRQLAGEYPASNSGRRMRLFPLNWVRVGKFRSVLWLLLGATGFVLLIACINLANLLLTRMSTRRREVAVRAALGANRFRLVRQLLTEGLMLSILGGTAGVLLARWGVDLFLAFSPGEVLRVGQVGISFPMLAFAMGLSLVTEIAVGLCPALQAWATGHDAALKEAGRGGSEGHVSRRFRSLLVIGEIALTVVLLAGAGLTLNSFARLVSVDPGFDPENVLMMSVHLPLGKLYHKSAAESVADLQSAEGALKRIEQLPGVRSAATGGRPPTEASPSLCQVRLSGRTDGSPEEEEAVTERSASHGYFKTMGIPVLKGRTFNSTEKDPDRIKIAVINRAMADRYWPGKDPVGERINDLQIIGVVGNVRMCGLDIPAHPEFYTPLCSLWNQHVVVRTDRNPRGFIAEIKGIIADADKDVSVPRVATMGEVISGSVARPRFVLFLLGSFAVLAVILAVVGIYGVMAYAVNQRVHEIGIRMALGAQRGDVLRMVIRQGLILTVIGLVIGLGGAFALTRYLRSLLYEVSPTDPLTFAAVTVLLGAVALLACYIPARRATRIDPISAIRYE